MILRTSDRDVQRRVERSGFTVWLDASGSENRNFGIHYPIGMRYAMPSGGPAKPPHAKMKKSQKPDTTNAEVKPDTMEFHRRFVSMMDTLEIIGPKPNERRSYLFHNVPGISVSFTDTTGMMIYELRIPLGIAGDSSYALAAKSGGTISIGLESGAGVMPDAGKRDTTQYREPPRGPGWGGMGGMGGYPDNGGGMRPDRGGRGMIGDPIEFWAKVVLAVPGTTKGE